MVRFIQQPQVTVKLFRMRRNYTGEREEPGREIERARPTAGVGVAIARVLLGELTGGALLVAIENHSQLRACPEREHCITVLMEYVLSVSV
jgi:hypothetical protein